MLNSLKDLIERCHQRRVKPLTQRKTMALPSMFTKGHFYQHMVYCARKYPVLLDDLEAADISFMPIGRAPENDRGPKHFGGELFFRRTKKEHWGFRRWNTSWGLQVYTGIPSERYGARWHDLHFTYQALCAAPNAVFACIEALVSTIANPLLTLSKSGGLRFSCRIPDYLHPDTEQEKLYIYKHTPTPENPQQRDVYLEILGEKGYSRWDARYEILFGNLLDPPVIIKEALFAQIDALRAVLHEPAPEKLNQIPTIPAAPLRLGSYQLDLAKEAFMQRGFSYVHHDNGSHLWILSTDTAVNDIEVLLWEDAGTVWVRASAPDIGIPMTATPITDVWDDTGILPPLPATGLPVTDRVLAVREGLSPLAIKRSPPMLQKAASTEKVLETFDQMRRVFGGTARVIGLTVSQTAVGNNSEIESLLLNSNAICLSMPTPKLAAEIEQHFQAENVASVVRWKERMHRWDQVKAIPIDVRMASPFQHGNVCEDPERCDALERKGGNPSESICPQCPVYTECRDRGYLSQLPALQHAKAQIVAIPQLFFNPKYAEVVDAMLEPIDETQRFCVINETTASQLFLKCILSKDILEAWGVNWQGSALGNFAKTLLNALEVKGKPHSDAVRGVRAAIQAFEWQAAEIIRQMCQINVQGKVVDGGIVDADTGEKLAHLTIEFEGGSSAYIPLDDNATDRLMAKGLPFFRLNAFVVNKNMKIPMAMAAAIRLGILDTKTVQDIQEFPSVCSDRNWTFWHQLKRFFSHYTRDDDAPIRWNGKALRFWMPPVLHHRVKRLLVRSSTLSKAHLRSAFPNEEIEVIRTKPTAWVPGNQVFQIRTDIYPRETILDYDSTWNFIGTSKTGQQFLLGIRAEIEREPKVKHAIITDSEIIEPLRDIASKENVCFLSSYQKMIDVEIPFQKMAELETAFEAAEIIWILGAPARPQGLIWRSAQILFGNHEKRLSYQEQTGSNRYTDERVQSIYEHKAASLLIEVLEAVGLNRRAGKKVVLLTGLRLPNITDRPETLLFDWEDFQVAGGLEKLAEVIATRQHFETQSANLTAKSSRRKVEEVLGCPPRHANRVLQRLRGGAPLRVPLREQILSALADGQKKTAELVAAVDGHPKAIDNQCRNLVNKGEIVRVRRGVYARKKESDATA